MEGIPAEERRRAGSRLSAASPPDASGTARAFASILEARYACKRFDPAQTVAEGDRRFILDAGRLSPSSFGLEPWLFVVADSPARKRAFFEACFAQESLSSADFVVTIAVRRAAHYAPDSRFVAERAARFPGGLPAFLEEYRGYWEYLDSGGLVEHWARAQGYIACANMMNAAAALGVDSCAIEGFAEEATLAAAELDAEDWRVSLVVPFGFRGEAVRPKIRENLDSIVKRLQPPAE